MVISWGGLEKPEERLDSQAENREKSEIWSRFPGGEFLLSKEFTSGEIKKRTE